MTRVDQRFHDDCLRACAATQLGLAYEETPALRAAGMEGETFWLEWEAWAAARGLAMWWFAEPPVHLPRWIACVPSLTMPGKSHVVVMRRTGLFHDPSPRARREEVVPGDVRESFAFLPVERRDHSNVRGPRPRLQRRGPILDVVFPADWRFPWGSGVGLGWGPTYGTCVHGRTWPEGDYMEPRGRACVECVREAFGGWRP